MCSFVAIRDDPARPFPASSSRCCPAPIAGRSRKVAAGWELAQAIVDPANPLTARVLVNRVWLWHFGAGLVTTPSDFGLRSDPPSHPELLDDLALFFIKNGWSIKALHRRIMLLSTYQEQSNLRPDCLNRDPQNRLLWRFNRQRLDFEALRDSILAVAGTLEETEGGPSVVLSEPPFPPRRTVYGFIDRQNLDGVYRTFDFAVPDATSPKRFVTTVPQQALFLMNSPFVQSQARALAARIDAREPRSRRIASAWLTAACWPDLLSLASLPWEQRFWTGTIPPPLLSPLAQLVQVLMLTNEFTFVD